MKYKSLGFFLIVLMVITVSGCKKDKRNDIRKRGELKKIWYNGSYNRDFNDLNEVHLKTAKSVGIKPISSHEDVKKASPKMLKIQTNEYYEVEKLTHSIPFLVPEAARLLEDIGKNFQDSLYNLNASQYKVKVTSVTRTVDDVQSLGKRNSNASSNSAHQYGTTFDISWVRYSKVNEKDTLDIDNERLKMVLAMVLRDLRSEERCYVKHERKQGCFHITAR